jgi:hypothetical protein
VIFQSFSTFTKINVERAFAVIVSPPTLTFSSSTKVATLLRILPVERLPIIELRELGAVQVKGFDSVEILPSGRLHDVTKRPFDVLLLSVLVRYPGSSTLSCDQA